MTRAGPPLHVAASHGNEEIAADLLREGARVDATASDTRTPLLTSKSKEVCELLLKKRAHMEAHTKDGKTPLTWVTTNGFAEAVNCLKENGANPFSADAAGFRARDFALSSSHANQLPQLPQRRPPDEYGSLMRRPEAYLNLLLSAIVTATAATWPRLPCSEANKTAPVDEACPLATADTVQAGTRRPFRGAVLLGTRTLCKRQGPAKAFRAAEAFANTILPMRLMLGMQPALWIPTLASVYVAPAWALTGIAPWKQSAALFFSSAKETLLGPASLWRSSTRRLCFVGAVRTLLLVAAYLAITQEVGRGLTSYANTNGQEATKLLAGNRQHAICIPLLPSLPTAEWQVTSGKCTVDPVDACLHSPPDATGCEVAVPGLGPMPALYTVNAPWDNTYGGLRVGSCDFTTYASGNPASSKEAFPLACANDLFPGASIHFKTAGDVVKWKICRKPGLCVPLPPVKDTWRALDLVGATISVLWVAITVLLPLLACCFEPSATTTAKELHLQVQQLALKIGEACEPGPGGLDKFWELHELELGEDGKSRLRRMTVWSTNALKMGLAMTILFLLLSTALDLNSANTLLLHGEVWFAGFLLIVASASTFHEILSGTVRKVYEDLAEIARTGVLTENFMDLADSERGTEAVLSLLVTANAMPFAVQTPAELITAALSRPRSVYGLATYLHEQIDLKLLGLADEGAEQQEVELGCAA